MNKENKVTTEQCACVDTDARKCFEKRYPDRDLNDVFEPYERCGCPCHEENDDECDCYDCADKRIV